ncbi:MAG: Nramp family divalent metal transporter [bacterium]|nr:Nramp family divalent metal transporter [bacterium]
MMNKEKPFPSPIPFRKLIGPSFVILALGLGSGEVILWPYLASNYGLGIAWGAILGISFQYIINMEIERYALVKGESVFVGIAKFWRGAPYWFILSTFVGFGIPGIIAASATVFAALFGIANFSWIAILFLIAIGLILSSGKTVYGLMERITKTIILVGVPVIFVLTIILSTKTDWTTLLSGMVGIGDGYLFFPEGIVLATFLAAFAYSGAGGNLNLTQSIYVKEKGYGMGKYAQRIGGLFRKNGVEHKIELEGISSSQTEQDKKNFRIWWRRISMEHALVFWFIGSLSIMLLMLLAYITTAGLEGNAHGIQFVINEGIAIGSAISPGVGAAFLLVVAIMLFQTQLGVMDSTSRIMAENAAISYTKHTGNKKIPLSKIYFGFLWTQVAFGVLLFTLGISEPKTLLILGACLNAIAMFVHIGLVSFLNYRALPKCFQPSVLRRIILLGIFLFFGFFSGVVVISQLF